MGNISTNGTITGSKFIGPVTNKQVYDIARNDYVIKAIACCKASPNATGEPCSWSSGRLVPHRINGIYMTPTIDYTMHTQYGTTNGIFVNYQTTGRDLNILYPAVFTYNGVKYGGFIYQISDATDYYLGIDVVGNFEPIHCGAIYNTSNNTVLNSEIYNSINTSVVYAAQGINACGPITTSTLYLQNGGYGSALPSGGEGQVFFKI